MKANDRSRDSAVGSTREELRDESGAFPIGQAHREQDVANALDAIEELEPEKVALIPEPPPESMRPRARSVRPASAERAQLLIEDLTLRPDNPYLASSLVPPPQTPASRRRKVALIAAGMLGAAAVGGLIELMVLRADVDAPRAAAPVAAPAPKTAAAPKSLPPMAVPAAAPAEPAVPAAVVAPVALAGALSAPVSAPALETPEAPKSEAAVVAPVTAKPVAPVAAKVAPVALPAPPEPNALPAEPAAAAEVAPLGSAAPVAEAEPAVTEKPAAAAAEPVANAEPVAEATALAPSLTREQVAAGFDALRPALEQCAAGVHGVVQIDAAIAGSGRVAHALIGGAFVGTPAGSCMARAVRAARFPASAQERMNVRYPISL